MKIHFLALILLLSIVGCSNEFELNAPAMEIPIVYGLLSRADEVHYIRVERAFIDNEIAALDLAQQPDNLYFDNIIVELVRERTGDSFLLERIDGNQIDLERDPGIFATTPNILYQISASTLNLQAEETYRLNIRNPVDEMLLTTATTPIVSDLRLNRPIPGEQKLPLRILEDDEITIVWGANETARLFDVSMVINYDEFNPNDPNSLVEQSIVWRLTQNQTAVDGPNRIEPLGLEFYQFLSAVIPENTTLLRTLKTIDIRIDAGGEELFNYINVGQANTGITSAQVIPNYTNLSNGLGLFASRNTFLERGFVIDSQTREILQNNPLTRNLNFR